MRIEKNLIFPEPVEKIIELQVNEGFSYQHDDDGIRAIGPLYIKGKYESNGEHKFQEVLEMDVLAPQEKLGNDSFYLEIGEYEAKPTQQGIFVEILLHIHGLAMNEKNEDKKEIVDVEVPADVVPQPAIPASMYTSPNTVETTELPSVPVEEVAEVEKEIDSIEDLFDDNENVYTSYRMIVAKPNDSYATIAQRYGVDESALRATNKDKEVQVKTLIVLPYQSA